MQNNREYPHAVALGVWLLICAVVVYIMVVVGGITRLTQSGLSMVEWAPIMGIFPPLDEATWLEIFRKYQAFPEYQKINLGMSLVEFKNIFWWEYGHRVLGRFIGLIYLLPLLFFLAKGMVPKAWLFRLFALFVLGGLQGLMGWYMVKSGLVDVPYVSQYRLVAHLGLALLIFATMFWYSMDFLRSGVARQCASKTYRNLTGYLVVVVFLMMLSGGFVAGTKAGFIMNTFPKMSGQWLPDTWMAMSPWWRNFFENPITVQFMHRCLALVVAFSAVLTFWQARKQNFATRADLVILIMLLQISLGIAALVLIVPIVLGAAHQAGAVALLASALLVAHCARKLPRSAV